MKTKREEFLNWCRQKEYVSSVDAIQWGLDNFYIGSRNVINLFVKDGYCERLNLAQKLSLGLLSAVQTEIAFYHFKKSRREISQQPELFSKLDGN